MMTIRSFCIFAVLAICGMNCENSCSVDNCIDCIADECSKCDTGYDLDGISGVCQSCSAEGCAVCPSGFCNECRSGFYLTGALQCPACPTENCAVCPGGMCDECQSGYYFKTAAECAKCPSGCKTCTDTMIHPNEPTTCTSCENNYELNGQGECVQECQISKRPIQHLEKLYRGLTIFVDFTFQCAGTVSSLEFYAEHPGTFYFSAWRPSATNDAWTLQGYNTITVEMEGAQNYTILSGTQLTVEASDVIGIFYPKGRHPRIISSKNIRKRERDNTSSSRYVHTRDTVDDLEFGFNRSTLANEGNSERIIPFNAIISG